MFWKNGWRISRSRELQPELALLQPVMAHLQVVEPQHMQMVLLLQNSHLSSHRSIDRSNGPSGAGCGTQSAVEMRDQRQSCCLLYGPTVVFVVYCTLEVAVSVVCGVVIETKTFVR